MAIKSSKDINAAVDSDLADEFYRQIDARGQKVKRAIAGAIRLWLTLTPAEQNLWIEGKFKQAALDAIPSESEIYQDLAILGDLVRGIDAKIKRSEQARSKKTSRRLRRVGD